MGRSVCFPTRRVAGRSDCDAACLRCSAMRDRALHGGRAMSGRRARAAIASRTARMHGARGDALFKHRGLQRGGRFDRRCAVEAARCRSRRADVRARWARCRRARWSEEARIELAQHKRNCARRQAICRLIEAQRRMAVATGRIPRGANPRVPWTTTDQRIIEHYRLDDDGVLVRERGRRGRRRVWARRRYYVEFHTFHAREAWFDTLCNEQRLPVSAFYVPFDVARWRDPKHRAELRRRAQSRTTK